MERGNGTRPDDADDRDMSVPSDEVEPDWAEQIRQLCKARGDRLKVVFATFEDEEEQ